MLHIFIVLKGNNPTHFKNYFMNQLLEIVLHPQKYRHIANLPLRFDAAEQLLEYWYILSPSHKRAVSRILISSGKYTA